MLRVTIPEITENKKLPEDLRWKRGKKSEKIIEDGYSSKKLIWECISRAHRDVLSGRKNVEDYSSDINADGINNIALELYNKINENKKNKNLSSERLIEYLVLEKNHRIGPVQKLVNMTLKYMFLLQLFEKLEGYKINENDCDCPLDSRIMDKLGMEDIKWTKDFGINEKIEGYQKYRTIQQEIQNKQGKKSRLLYDFDNWQQF